MKHFLRAALAVALAAAPTVSVAAQTAAPPAPTAEASAQRDFEAAMAFTARLGEVVNLQTASMKKLLEAKPLMNSLTTPAAIKANGPKVRGIIAEARSGIARSVGMIAALNPPAVRIGTMSLADALSEARQNTAGTLALLDDYDAFVAALMRGDHAAARTMAPKLMRGSFVMMDSMRSTYRSRQAMTPDTSSVHQALGTGTQLYRAMGEAGRGWYNAVVARKGEAAAAQLRSELVATGRELRALSQAGRANMARELAALDTRSKGFTGSEAVAMARLRDGFAQKERFFAMGDDLAALCEKAAPGVTAAQLSGQSSPALLEAMVPLELRFHAAIGAMASTASGQAAAR